MSVVPANKLQQRIRQGEMHAQRPDAWARNIIRGVIVEVYDRYTREQSGTPPQVAAKIARSPGLVMAKVFLLDKKVLYLPMAISADERHLLYGNGANMVGRPVEVEYYNQDIYNGKVYLKADNLNLGVREDVVAEPFDIASAVS